MILISGYTIMIAWCTAVHCRPTCLAPLREYRSCNDAKQIMHVEVGLFLSFVVRSTYWGRVQVWFDLWYWGAGGTELEIMIWWGSGKKRERSWEKKGVWKSWQMIQSHTWCDIHTPVVSDSGLIWRAWLVMIHESENGCSGNGGPWNRSWAIKVRNCSVLQGCGCEVSRTVAQGLYLQGDVLIVCHCLDFPVCLVLDSHADSVEVE